jgi:hypothetical protein
MPKGTNPKKKLPGEDLEKTLKTNLENMKPEELRVKVSEVALYKQAQENMMKNDPEVKQKRDALNEELADYRMEIKGAKEQIAFITYLLESQGKL